MRADHHAGSRPCGQTTTQGAGHAGRPPRREQATRAGHHAGSRPRGQATTQGAGHAGRPPRREQAMRAGHHAGSRPPARGGPTIYVPSTSGTGLSSRVGPPPEAVTEASARAKQATGLTFYHKFDRQLVIESKRKLSARKESCDDATIDAVVATAVGRGYLWFGPVGRSTAKSSCRCHCARVGERDGSLVAQATA